MHKDCYDQPVAYGRPGKSEALADLQFKPTTEIRDAKVKTTMMLMTSNWKKATRKVARLISNCSNRKNPPKKTMGLVLMGMLEIQIWIVPCRRFILLAMIERKNGFPVWV